MTDDSTPAAVPHPDWAYDADWSQVIQAISDAVADGEGDLYEGYLRRAFARHGLTVVEAPS